MKLLASKNRSSIVPSLESIQMFFISNYHASGNPNLREKIQTEKFGARPRTIQKASSRAIKAEGGQREPGPGQYRRL